MKKFSLLLFAAIAFSMANAQKFNLGVMMAMGSAKKNTNGTIELTDSTFTIVLDGVRTQRKVINRTGDEYQITDGTATDKIKLAAISGELKGFNHTHVFIEEKDKKVGGGPIFYYCAIRKE